jgi:hypothetical protein
LIFCRNLLDLDASVGDILPEMMHLVINMLSLPGSDLGEPKKFTCAGVIAEELA